mgnify:CR=1 FL=1
MYLNTHSYYSLKYGTLSIDKLTSLAKKNNVQAMALTDINNSSGILDFVRACNTKNIHPIAGIEFRNQNQILFTGLAKNNDGFHELNQFLSEHNLEKKKLPPSAPEMDNTFIVYPFGSKKLQEIKENEYIGIRPAETGKLLTSDYRKDTSKLIVWQPVTFENQAGYALHKNLRAIGENKLISQLRPEDLAQPSEIMCSIDKLSEYYNAYPNILKNTEKIICNCNFSFDFKSHKNKKTFTGSEKDDEQLLRWIAEDGFLYRYNKNNPKAWERLQKELNIIFKLSFTAYFLITWDIIRFSMSKGFYHVGRGSGANSIVAYCIKITDVDPIELDLYFERFLNPRRTSPPDFDIDYSWKERNTVQEYIFKRYGKQHTALLGAMSTFKGKSIYRELGKVYGLPKEEIDQLVDYPEQAINKNNITQKIHLLKEQMTNFPNIRSIHAGGILISELPITYYTALDMPPKGFPTTQWDMYVAEDIGFEKLDILSQRGIGHIKECAEIVLKNRAENVDVHNVKKFKTDEKVKRQLKDGETIGCFYIESPAMRGLLKKLRCEDYLTLVAASSIIRPGVARSGMMKEYIRRFHHPESIKYLHPVMKEQLEETFGVMVYQEDVLKVCHHFADLDLSDADILRRAMSGKHRSGKEFERIQNKFFSNCQAKGYSLELTKEVWRQIASFAGYSFSKAHSASYAVESFQSLYLKTYYPLEFMVAVINNFGGFYKTWVYFNEAKRSGAEIMLPCVNNSLYKTSIQGTKIYIGFIHMANLEKNIGKKIPEERNTNGPFLSLGNFVTRLQPGTEQLNILIKAGAFSFTGKSKSELLWEAYSLQKNKKPAYVTNSLFPVPSKTFTLPKLEHSQLEDTYDELELLEFTVSTTHFNLVRNGFRGEIMATDLCNNIGKKFKMMGHLVTIKFVRTIKKELMQFGTFLDVEGNFFDTVHFPNSLNKYPFRGSGIYLILGKIVEEFGYPSMEVEKMQKVPLMPDPRDT